MAQEQGRSKEPQQAWVADMPIKICEANARKSVITRILMLNTHKLTPSIGAEISGLDLTKPLSQGEIAALNDSLVEHKVIFFRDQPITTSQHLTFARQFGELEVHPVTPKEGFPEVLVLHNDADRPPLGTAHWHSDVTWRAEPSLGSILIARTVPDLGGDTMFANMEAAYEGLDSETKALIEGENAIHAFEPLRRSLIQQGASSERLARHDADFPPVSHPIVRTHPATGRKSLYVNILFTLGIDGFTNEASRPLLKKLFATANKPEYQCRFRWRKNSMAFWDNRAAQHYAVADYYPNERIMERVTVKGDRPF
ncbi:MAG: taurine dioxygenase [Candidatus Azotimanducaceae bacterium]|jgi:taurine dioxygenase